MQKLTNLIAVILFSLLSTNCNSQINPTICVNDENKSIYQGVEESPKRICEKISEEFGSDISINLLVSAKSNLGTLATLKNELAKAKLRKINYAPISSINSKFNLNGKWKVVEMANSSIYALEIDKKYLGEILQTEHNQIINTTNLSLLNNVESEIPVVSKSIEQIPIEDISNLYRLNLDALKLNGETIYEVNTNYIDHPLDVLLITDENELIIGWDGLYLKLEIVLTH